MLRVVWQYLIKPVLVLLLLFQICKTLFLFSNRQLLEGLSLIEITAVFRHSLSLDLATISYLLLLPLVALLFQSFFKKDEFFHQVIKKYYLLVGIVYITIAFIDIELFSYWSSKLSAKALSFMNTPLMAFKSSGQARVLFLFLIIFVMSYLLYFVFELLMKSSAQLKLLSKGFSLVFFLLAGILILGLRGGFREIPINQSDAYFSDNIILNVAGVNSLWNFGNVLFQNFNTLQENPYKTMSDERAENIFKELYSCEKDTSVSLFTIEHPNIIYIALEGVNANCIRNYNAKNNYMPELSLLMQEGYSFKNIFASGMRTDQGLVSILSGFPALPLNTLGAQPEKFQYLPSLSLAMLEEGYHNNFFFAGEPEFGSFKAFLVHNGFEKVYSFEDFDKENLTQELGAPDEFLFEKFLKDMSQAQEPFFSLMLTQSTHEPFDMPFNEGVKDDAKKYINTVKYVDSLIGAWYESCRKMPWFEETIIIISSDHAHTFPERYWYTDKERYRIPFIVLGGALLDEFRGKENEGLYNQTDIPLSLAKQLKLKEQNFEFSKDINNPYSPQFSSYIHIHGHNWLRNESFCSVDYNLKHDFGSLSDEEDKCTLENAAYFQYVFKQYMDY